jgi:hypothetical protein
MENRIYIWFALFFYVGILLSAFPRNWTVTKVFLMHLILLGAVLFLSERISEEWNGL